MGTGHSKNFREGKVENGVLTAVCDINPKKLDAFKERFADKIAYFDNAEDMFKSGLCDCVIICTPHYSHTDLAISALDHDLNCIVEKPAGVYTLQVKEMLARAEKSDKILGIMFNQRTNPAFKTMKKMIAEGKIGEIKRTNWIITDWYRTQYYYDSGDWRATWSGEGGGVLLNQCPHQLDLWQWIFGMPSKIRGFCSYGKYHDIEVEDDVTAYAEYDNGATAVFITTTGECPGTNRLEISGSKGKIIAEGKKLTFVKNLGDEREHCFTVQAGFEKLKTETIELTPEYDMLPQHKGITQNFTNHLLHGEPLMASGYEGINGLTISNAIMLSAWKDEQIDVTDPAMEDEFYERLKVKIAGSRRKEKVVDGSPANLAGTYNN